MAGKKQVLEVQDETVICCREPCRLSAKTKVKTPTGWANFCLEHYHEYYTRQSEEYCNALGLDTTEKRIAWLKQHAKGLTKRYTANIPPREPGEDREEDAA